MIQVAAVILALSTLFCAEQKNPTPTKQDSTKSRTSNMTVSQVLEKYTDEWMAIPGVVGTGEGETDGKPSIIVFVEEKSETIEKKIPKTIEGHTVVIEVTGKIEPLE